MPGKNHPMPAAPDFDKAPFLVIWEVTQACALACLHCRAEAIDFHHPEELTFEEGKRLVDQVKEMGCNILIFSGGDPLQREDLDDLIRYGKKIGLRVGTIPAATGRLTEERVRSLQEAGLDQMAVSIDGPTAEIHDQFRGVPGAFDKTMAAAGWARKAGLPLQVNTTFAAWNLHEFDRMAELVESLGVVFWEIFFLVPIGRGAEMQVLRAEQYEKVFEKIYRLQKRASFIVKITEGPHYRRYVAEQERRRRDGGGEPTGVRVRRLLARETGPGGSVGQAPRGVNSGKGFLFVSHRGEVFPSGFLPIRAGSVREQSLAEIYRNSEVFLRLRDPKQLKGRCGYCEYRDLCGGSRSRAFALTGDALAEDDGCDYQPRSPRRTCETTSAAPASSG